MNLTYRRELRAGQVFGFPHKSQGFFDSGLLSRGAFVVIDEKTEIEFWSGVRFAYGDVAPGVIVEVLS